MRTCSIYVTLIAGLWSGVVAAAAPSPATGGTRTLPIPPLDLAALAQPGCSARLTRSGDLVITLRRHIGNTYPVAAVIPKPPETPARFQYVLRFQSRFKPSVAGRPGRLGLGLCDSRGWTRTIQSAIAVSGAQDARHWENFRGVYTPLPDTPGVRLVLRIESGPHQVSGVWKIRDIRVQLRPIKAALSRAQIQRLQTIVDPAWQRLHAPKLRRGFNIQSLVRTWSRRRQGGFMPTVEYFRTIRRWGGTVVRMPFDPAGIAKDWHVNAWKIMPQLLDDTAQAVKNARAAGVKVVLVLANPPLAKADIAHDSTAFWHQPDLTASFCRLWRAVAKKLKPYDKTIYGYDLYNEPVNPADSGRPGRWRKIAIRIIETIRKVDRKVWIIYEPGPWGDPSGFVDLYPLPFRRVMYSFHFYSPHVFTCQGIYNTRDTDLRHAMTRIHVNYPGLINGKMWNKAALARVLGPVKKFQARWGVPIFAGEFSAVAWAPHGSAARWLADTSSLFNANHWTWCYLAFRSWPGWNLEDSHHFWRDGMPWPKPVARQTRRATVIKAALRFSSP